MREGAMESKNRGFLFYPSAQLIAWLKALRCDPFARPVVWLYAAVLPAVRDWVRSALGACRAKL